MQENPERSSLKERYRSLLEKAGMEGKFQKNIFIILVLAAYISAVMCTMMPLHKVNPEYKCLNKFDFIDDTFGDYSKYKTDTKRYSVNFDEHCVRKFCKDWPGFQSEILTVLVADYESNVNHISEMDLMCDEDFFVTFTQCMFLGRIFGLIVHSFLSDKYGRMLALNVQLYLQLGCVIISYFMKLRYSAFVLAFISNSCMNLWNHTALMSTEMMSEKMYSLAGAMTTLAFSLSGLINLAIMYYFKNWNIILAYHFIIICYIIYMSRFYMIETPLFLLENFNFREFRKTIKKINSINNADKPHISSELIKELKDVHVLEKIENSQNIFAEIRNSDFQTSLYVLKRTVLVVKSIFDPYLNILRNSYNIFNVLKFSVMQTSLLFIYYGQLLFVEELPGDMFFNLLVIYMTEILIEFVASCVCQAFPKKFLLLVCSLASAIFSLIIIIFMHNHFIVTINVFLLTCFNTIAVVALNIYASETIDIKVKSVSISICSVIANTSFLISPYLIMFLGNIYVTFMILSVFMFFFLLLVK